MEVSVSSDKLSNYFLDSHFLQSFKNLTTDFTESVPNSGFHQAIMPDELVEFLKDYFLTIVKSLDTVVTSTDIKSSEFCQLFKCIFYYFWKHILRFQEIYWLKSYDFNISEEIYFSNSCLELNHMASKHKAFILVNIMEDDLILNDLYLLRVKHFAVIIESTFTHFTFSKEHNYLFIPLY